MKKTCFIYVRVTQIALPNTLLIQLIYMLINYTLKHFNRITNEDMKWTIISFDNYRIPNNSNSQSFIPFELVESAKSIPISYCLGSHNFTKW